MRNFAVYAMIAWRYIRSFKKPQAINIITGIAIGGLAISTAALIIILSVFNGFRDLILDINATVKPAILISPDSGKFMRVDEKWTLELQNIPGIAELSKTVDEIAMFEYEGEEAFGRIKGVDENYRFTNEISQAIYSGSFQLGDSLQPRAVLGAGLSYQLNLKRGDAFEPLSVYMPNRYAYGPMSKPFNIGRISPAGTFSLHHEYDNNLVIAPISFVSTLLNLQENEVTGVELALVDGSDANEVKKRIVKAIGDKYQVQTLLEQDASLWKIMNIEKWMTFLIISLTLILIAFNVVSLLWMIVLDKSRDIATLKTMGIHSYGIRIIIYLEGIFVACIGFLGGLIISLFVYFIQKTYGIVTIPEGFIVDTYPIQLEPIDLGAVAGIVLLLGLISAILPAKRAVNVSPVVRVD